MLKFILIGKTAQLGDFFQNMGFKKVNQLFHALSFCEKNQFVISCIILCILFNESYLLVLEKYKFCVNIPF